MIQKYTVTSGTLLSIERRGPVASAVMVPMCWSSPERTLKEGQDPSVRVGFHRQMQQTRCVQDPQLGNLGASPGATHTGDLRELGDLSRWLVEASPDGLWVFDDDGHTVLANARMAQMLGRTPEEMPGLSVFETLDEQGQE